MSTTSPNHPLNWFAVDPSMQALGYAFSTSAGLPLGCGFIGQPSTKEDWQYRASWMASYLRYRFELDSYTLQLQSVDPNLKWAAVVECPNNWFTEKGMGSKDSEGVQKLYYTVGAIVAELRPVVERLYVITPNNWKGQLPKPIHAARARTHYANAGLHLPEGIPLDVTDAVMLAKAAAEAPMANETGVLIPSKKWSLIWDRGVFGPNLTDQRCWGALDVGSTTTP